MADLTPKQEAFALAFLETGNAAEAYRRAYDVAPDAKDNWLYVEACQLLDNPKVALKLKELRDQAERLSVFNTVRALEEYEEARLAALAAEMPAAAVSATTGKVKLLGLDSPRKIAVTGPNGGPIQTQDMTAADVIAARLAAIKSRATGEPDA